MAKGPRRRQHSSGRYHKAARRGDIGASGSSNGSVVVRDMRELAPAFTDPGCEVQSHRTELMRATMAWSLDGSKMAATAGAQLWLPVVVG